MQPDSSKLEQLAQLPLIAMEALLDSNQLKVLSENTTLAAVTYWIEHEDSRRLLTAEQLQRLAFKLRLCNCSRWYLTSQLMDRKGWLYCVLTHEQQTVLLASVGQPQAWRLFMSDDPGGSDRLLFGPNCQDTAHWWKEARDKSTAEPLTFQITPVQIWNAPNKTFAMKTIFTNGLHLRLGMVFDECDECAGSQEAGRQKLYELHFMARQLQDQRLAAYDVKVVMSPTQPRLYPDATQMIVRDPSPKRAWSVSVMGAKAFHSLAAAIAGLQTYIHADGRLHISVNIEVN